MGPWVSSKVQAFPLRQVNWRGRSGRFYPLVPVRLHDFALRDGELYLVALGSHVLWAGSAHDIVADSASRARFRLALDCADRAFLVGASTDEVERLTTIWDLEGAEPVTGVVAA
jgi:hypothetical protein